MSFFPFVMFSFFSFFFSRCCSVDVVWEAVRVAPVCGEIFHLPGGGAELPDNRGSDHRPEPQGAGHLVRPLPHSVSDSPTNHILLCSPSPLGSPGGGVLLALWVGTAEHKINRHAETTPGVWLSAGVCTAAGDGGNICCQWIFSFCLFRVSVQRFT